jgi:hypothetical protein
MCDTQKNTFDFHFIQIKKLSRRAAHRMRFKNTFGPHRRAKLILSQGAQSAPAWKGFCPETQKKSALGLKERTRKNLFLLKVAHLCETQLLDVKLLRSIQTSIRSCA